MMSQAAALEDDDLIDQLLVDAPPAIVALLIPAIFMYLSLYALAKGWYWTSRWLALPTLFMFWKSAALAPVRCAAFRSELDFGGNVARSCAL